MKTFAFLVLILPLSSPTFKRRHRARRSLTKTRSNPLGWLGHGLSRKTQPCLTIQLRRAESTGFSGWDKWVDVPSGCSWSTS